MQFNTHSLLHTLGEFAGWALILFGSTLALSALAEKRAPKLAFLRRPQSSPMPLATPRAAVRIDPFDEWERLESIAEQGYSGIMRVAELHAHASEAVAAADDAVRELLADWAVASPHATAASSVIRNADDEPQAVDQPLAA